jgi:hypothetical protein
MFKGFIRRIQERIEKNATKIPNISWVEKNGTIHTEDIILKRSRIPLIGDWARIYPPVDENGKTLWINAIFGGKQNFIRLLLILGILALFLLGFYETFHSFEMYKLTCVQTNGTIIP